MAAETKRRQFRSRRVEELPALDATVVRIQSGASAKSPLFCVHAQAGDVSLYQGIARHLPQDQPVLGLCMPPLGKLGPDMRLARLAEYHVGEITAVQPRGPYWIVGECTGGALAYEIAQQLQGAGEEVALLALIDAFPPQLPRLRRFMPRALYRVFHRVRILGFHLGNLVRLEGAAKLGYVVAKAQRARAALARKAAPRLERSDTGGSPQRAFREALAAYEPRPFAGTMVLFRAARLPLGIETTPDFGWGTLVEELQVETLPGYFTTPISEPGVRVLADRLASHLARAGGKA